MIAASRPQDGVQYALPPDGALALLGVPAAELAGIAVDLTDVVGSGAGT